MACLLLLEEVDELDVTELSKVPFEPLVSEGLKVLYIPNVDVPCSSGVDSQSQSGGEGPRVLSPADLESAVVQSESLV